MASIFGSILNDRLIGGRAADSILGQAGNDVISGGAGNDQIFGAQGDDLLLGGAGNDVISADGAGPNLFLVTRGNDVASGGAGNDLIATGAGRDILQGDAGRDTLNGGAGRDILDGGRERDVLIWDPRDLAVDGGAGFDRLQLGGADLDLRVIADGKIRGIELIDMSGGVLPDKLTLGEGEVLDLSSTRNTLRVAGNAGDVVDITGVFTDQGFAGQFHVYRVGSATLLVETDVLVI
jgi:Ca2+-binding RTX toxin-like protein